MCLIITPAVIFKGHFRHIGDVEVSRSFPRSYVSPDPYPPARARGALGCGGDFKGDVLNGDARSRPRDGIGAGCSVYTYVRARASGLSPSALSPLSLQPASPRTSQSAIGRDPRCQAASVMTEEARKEVRVWCDGW